MILARIPASFMRILSCLRPAEISDPGAMTEEGEGAACDGQGLPRGVRKATYVLEHDSEKGSAATGGLKSSAALSGAVPSRAHGAGPCLSLRLLVEDQQQRKSLDGLQLAREERAETQMAIDDSGV